RDFHLKYRYQLGFKSIVSVLKGEHTTSPRLTYVGQVQNSG
ncbi:hypothetical protein CEXT_941, partial [Caerostris extrusa]